MAEKPVVRDKVSDWVHDLFASKSDQYNPKLRYPQEQIKPRATPQAMRGVIESGGMGAEQQKAMKGALDAQQGK